MTDNDQNINPHGHQSRERTAAIEILKEKLPGFSGSNMSQTSYDFARNAVKNNILQIKFKDENQSTKGMNDHLNILVWQALFEVSDSTARRAELLGDAEEQNAETRKLFGRLKTAVETLNGAFTYKNRSMPDLKTRATQMLAEPDLHSKVYRLLKEKEGALNIVAALQKEFEKLKIPYTITEALERQRNLTITPAPSDTEMPRTGDENRTPSRSPSNPNGQSPERGNGTNRNDLNNRINEDLPAPDGPIKQMRSPLYT